MLIDQNWIVTLKKQDHLEEIQVLTTRESIPRVVEGLLRRYGSYQKEDRITIQQTEMVYRE